MPHPYVQFVELAAALRAPASPSALDHALAAAREAWAGIYADALRAGELPAGRFGLFVPALERLAAAAPTALDRVNWYRTLFGMLEREGLVAVGALIRATGDALASGGRPPDARQVG